MKKKEANIQHVRRPDGTEETYFLNRKARRMAVKKKLKGTAVKGQTVTGTEKYVDRFGKRKKISAWEGR